MHLSTFILVITQLDAQNFCFTISLFHASTCFKHHVLIIRRSKLHYTASGIITPIEAWNKLIVKQKFCVSSWLITKIKKDWQCPYKRNNEASLCVRVTIFAFYLQLSSETFTILRVILRDIINVHRYSRKVPVILVRFSWNLNLFDSFSKNIQTWNFMKFRAVGAGLFHAYGRTDRNTDGWVWRS